MKTTPYYYTILAVLFTTGAFASSSDNNETFEELERRRQAATASYDSSSSSSSSSSSGSSSSSSSVTDDNIRKRSERIEEAHEEEQAQKVARTQQLHHEIMQPLLIRDPLVPFFDAIARNDFESIYKLLQAEKNDTYWINEFINSQEYKNFLKNLIAERKFSNILQLDQEGFVPNDTSITKELSKRYVKLQTQEGRVLYFVRPMLIASSKTIAQLLDPTFLALLNETEQWNPLDMPNLSFFALLNIKYMLESFYKFNHEHRGRRDIGTLRNNYALKAQLLGEENATIENISELINAATFLDISSSLWLAIGAAIVHWAHKKPDTRWAELNKFDSEKKHYIYIALKRMNNITPHMITREYIYNKDGAFGVSIQNIIDYGLAPILRGRGGTDVHLDFSSSLINDLTGLDNIPGIKIVTTLLLDNNYISSIDNLNIFNNLTNLSYVNFVNNPISSNTSWQAKIRKKIKEVIGNKRVDFMWKR